MHLDSCDRDDLQILVGKWNAVIDSLSSMAEWQEILLAGAWGDDRQDKLAELGKCGGLHDLGNLAAIAEIS